MLVLIALSVQQFLASDFDLCTRAMAPKAKPKTPWNEKNVRAKNRREAVSLLNVLAAEVLVKPVLVKATGPDVEKLVRLLEDRCRDGDRPERPRFAARLENKSVGKSLPLASVTNAAAGVFLCVMHGSGCTRPPTTKSEQTFSNPGALARAGK